MAKIKYKKVKFILSNYIFYPKRSFGCVVYEMFELQRLFKGSSLDELNAKILKDKIQIPQNLDEEFEQVLNKYRFENIFIF
jgi:hypothetical protein